MNKHSLNEKVITNLLDLNDVSQQVLEKCGLQYKADFQNSIKNNGKPYTVNRYKEHYKGLCNYYLNLNPKPIAFSKIDKNNIPKILWSIRPIINSKDLRSKRIGLTVTRIFETIRLPIDPTKELKRVTDDGVFLTKDYTDRFTQFVDLKYRNHWSKKLSLKRERVIYPASVGPNGPALASSHLDAIAIDNDVILEKAITEINVINGNSWMNRLRNNQIDQINENKRSIVKHSKLGFSSEGGGKTRMFAICDYWSQLSLKSIHDHQMKILKSLGTDGTYDQNKAFERVLRESKGKKTYSYDLEGASHRIPLSQQVIRMKSIYGNTIAELGSTIIANRTFHSKFGDVRGKVGQPLGCLSSFPSFSLGHHDFVQFVAKQNGYKSFDEYQILGDDIVIGNERVAVDYENQIQEIGIPINLDKSIKEPNTESRFEFIKRLAHNGEEISGLNYNLVSKNKLINISELVTMLGDRKMIDNPQSFSVLPLVYPNNKDRSILINKIISLRLALMAQVSLVTHTCEVSYEDLFNKIKELRKMEILKKLEDLDKILSGITLEELVKNYGMDGTEAQMGNQGFNPEALHPVVGAINAQGEELTEVLDRIGCDDLPDMAPVEYLPTPNKVRYFPKYGDKPYEAYFSKLAITAFDELTSNSV